MQTMNRGACALLATGVMLGALATSPAQANEPGLIQSQPMEVDLDKVRMRKAGQLFSMKDYEGALEVWDRVLYNKPKQVEALYWSGLSLMYLKRPKEAEERARKAIELRRNDFRNWELLGLALKARYREEKTPELLGEAVESFKKAIKENHEVPRLHMYLAECYILRGAYAGAIASYKDALELKPDHALAHRQIAFSFAQLYDYEQAIPHAEKAVELDADNEQYKKFLKELREAKVEEDRLREQAEAERRAVREGAEGETEPAKAQE